MLGMIALIAIRIIVLPDGEFRGTCSTNSEFLKRENVDCPVCGKSAGETCKNGENMAPTTE